jgi:hypothetical protein
VRIRFCILSSLTAVASATLALPAVAADPRAVLELFTSQGCSSCPAADKLAGEIARDPSVIVMTLPVDYWDYLGWKDTLALKGHTVRQRGYAKSRGDREVYTPQVVVNGMAHVLGSDRVAIERTIQKTRSAAAPLTLSVKVAVAGDKLTVELPASGDGKMQGEVWLCPTSKAMHVEIGRGENKGRSVTYTNVVRRWVKLGEWTGKPETFTVPVSSLANESVDAVTVLVQPPAGDASRLMLGAAQASLR